MEKLTNFKVDPKRFAIYKEAVNNLFQLTISFDYLPIFIVHSSVKKLCCRTTLSACCLLFSGFINRTLVDKTGIVGCY